MGILYHKNHFLAIAEFNKFCGEILDNFTNSYNARRRPNANCNAKCRAAADFCDFEYNKMSSAF